MEFTQSIDSIPHPTILPMHVEPDASSSAPTPAATSTTMPSVISSPQAQMSLLSTPTNVHPSTNQTSVPLGPSHLSPVRTPLPRSLSRPSPADAAQASPISRTATSSTLDTYSPPSSSSPIPSLSQSYPQELDRERDVELLSHPSSGTSSPFTTFSPMVAAPQALSPFAVVQPFNQNPFSSEAETRHPWSLNPASRSSSPSEHTITTDAEYCSLPVSPTLPQSNFVPPVHITSDTRQPVRSPLLQESPSPPPPQAAHPQLINFTSPNPISPRLDLSDLEFESDFDVMSDQGSEGSGRSWAAISAGSHERR